MVPILTASLAAIVAFGLLVRRKKSELFWGWWSQLVASLISVVLGLAVGLHLLGVQKADKEAEDRARLRLLLEAEMGEVASQIKDSPPFTLHVRDSTLNQDVRLRLAMIQPVAIEEAAKSGLFTLEQTKTMFKVMRQIRLQNLETQNFLNAVSMKGSHVRFTAALAQDIVPLQEGILEDLRELAGQLGLQVAGVAPAALPAARRAY